MKTTTFALTAVALLAGVAGFASSANAAPMKHHAKGTLFSRIDTNHNNAISRKEFAAHYGSSRAASNVFRRLDTNHSGALSRAELSAGHAQLKALRA